MPIMIIEASVNALKYISLALTAFNDCVCCCNYSFSLLFSFYESLMMLRMFENLLSYVFLPRTKHTTIVNIKTAGSKYSQWESLLS